MWDSELISCVAVNSTGYCRHVHILRKVSGPASEACVYLRLQQISILDFTDRCRHCTKWSFNAGPEYNILGKSYINARAYKRMKTIVYLTYPDLDCLLGLPSWMFGGWFPCRLNRKWISWKNRYKYDMHQYIFGNRYFKKYYSLIYMTIQFSIFCIKNCNIIYLRSFYANR